MKQEFNSFKSEVARLIVNHPTLACALRDCDTEELVRQMNEPSGYEWMNVRFTGFGTEVNLYIEFESDYTSVEDEAGNDIRNYKVAFKTSHSSSTEAPTLQVQRANFYLKVAELAAELEREYQDTTLVRVLRSKAEKEELEAFNKKSQFERKLRNTVKNAVKHMRVGGEKSVQLASDNDFPLGTHEFIYANSKDELMTFTLSIAPANEISKLQVAWLKRTK